MIFDEMVEELDKQTPTYGDICVYIGEEPWHILVFLASYSDCENRVRVARLFENIKTRETGRWVSNTWRYKLEVGVALLCADDVTAAAPDSFLAVCVMAGISIGIGIPIVVVRLRVGTTLTPVLIHRHALDVFTLWSKFYL